MDPLSPAVLGTSSGSSVMGLCIVKERTYMEFCRSIYWPGLEVAYLALTHIPLARTQASLMIAPDHKGFGKCRLTMCL